MSDDDRDWQSEALSGQPASETSAEWNDFNRGYRAGRKQAERDMSEEPRKLLTRRSESTTSVHVGPSDDDEPIADWLERRAAPMRELRAELDRLREENERLTKERRQMHRRAQAGESTGRKEVIRELFGTCTDRSVALRLAEVLGVEYRGQSFTDLAQETEARLREQCTIHGRSIATWGEAMGRVCTALGLPQDGHADTLAERCVTAIGWLGTVVAAADAMREAVGAYGCLPHVGSPDHIANDIDCWCNACDELIAPDGSGHRDNCSLVAYDAARREG